MRGLTLRAGLLLGALALGGCASLSEKECRGGDWEAIGLEDGTGGAPAEQLDRHRDACSRHEIKPDEAAWRAGYARGLAEFCTPKGGYVAGRSARGDPRACDGKPGAEKFLEAYAQGREINSLRRIINEMRQDLHDLEMAAMSGDYSEYERTNLRLRASQLETEIHAREWELERLDADFSKRHGAPRLRGMDLR